MDIVTKLKQASCIFYETEQEQMSLHRDFVPIPERVLHYMPTLGIAVTIVEYFTPQQIQAMVMLDIAHRSTIKGASLSIARVVYDAYLKRENEARVRSLLKENEALWRERGFSRNHNYVLDGLSGDNLEQLRRVCTTAGNILEHRLF